MAWRGLALPLQADLLTCGNAGRNLDVELLARRQPDALLRAFDRLLQRNHHGDGEIEVESDAAGIKFEMAAAARTRARPCATAGRAAEHAVEDVLKPAGAGAAKSARACAAARADVIGL
jgi:hypothetical protein